MKKEETEKQKHLRVHVPRGREEGKEERVTEKEERGGGMKEEG